MLIEKKPVPNDVVTIRLISGEEVIGRYMTPDNNTTTKIKQPIIVGLQMLQNGQASLAFMPFLASTNEDSSITFQNSSLVVLPLQSRKDVAKRYIEATSSIEIPDAQTSSLILGS